MRVMMIGRKRTDGPHRLSKLIGFRNAWRWKRKERKNNTTDGMLSVRPWQVNSSKSKEQTLWNRPRLAKDKILQRLDFFKQPLRSIGWVSTNSYHLHLHRAQPNGERKIQETFEAIPCVDFVSVFRSGRFTLIVNCFLFRLGG